MIDDHPRQQGLADDEAERLAELLLGPADPPTVAAEPEPAAAEHGDDPEARVRGQIGEPEQRRPVISAGGLFDDPGTGQSKVTQRGLGFRNPVSDTPPTEPSSGAESLFGPRRDEEPGELLVRPSLKLPSSGDGDDSVPVVAFIPADEIGPPSRRIALVAGAIAVVVLLTAAYGLLSGGGEEPTTVDVRATTTVQVSTSAPSTSEASPSSVSTSASPPTTRDTTSVTEPETTATSAPTTARPRPTTPRTTAPPTAPSTPAPTTETPTSPTTTSAGPSSTAPATTTSVPETTVSSAPPTWSTDPPATTPPPESPPASDPPPSEQAPPEPQPTETESSS